MKKKRTTNFSCQNHKTRGTELTLIRAHSQGKGGHSRKTPAGASGTFNQKPVAAKEARRQNSRKENLTAYKNESPIENVKTDGRKRTQSSQECKRGKEGNEKKSWA